MPAADSWAASIREPATSASRHTKNALFLWAGFGTRRSEANPGSPLPTNTSQRDVMQQVRARLAKYHRSARSVRNAPSFNIGSGNWDIDFVLRGPDLEALGRLRRAFAHPLQRPRHHRRRHDAETRLTPSCAWSSTVKRAADLERRHRRHCHRAAPDGRRRHRSVALHRPDASTKSTTCNCACAKARPQRCGHDFPSLRAARGRRFGAAR